MATATDTCLEGLTEVPLRGMSGQTPVGFPLYIQTAPGQVVLYQPSQRDFLPQHEDRLLAEGIDRLFIREQDRRRYSRRVERDLDRVLRDRSVSVECRAAVLAGVAAEITRDVFSIMPDREELGRARQMMASTSSMMIREPRAFSLLRGLLATDGGLAEHSLTVSMLSLGLARIVCGEDPSVLLRAGLAGLLHDVGRIGQPHDPHDQEHASRGYHLLRQLELPQDICDVALLHHERVDGSGYPDGLNGSGIPRLARLVGLVDVFHHVYGDPAEGGGVFNALRVIAQLHRGAFDPTIASALVQLFGATR
ncbi:MAG: HD domain-containing protein [Planctomycetes bacterium]|nr:HD domain-containing protein [Planctomycetota bacterium]MCB9889602.1 HD domain-containing protein [Planctomycetota bacterium]